MTTAFRPRLRPRKKVLGKTQKMRAAEARIGKLLEDFLPESINEKGWKGTAQELGLTRSSDLNYWLKKFGIKTRFVAIRAGYKLVLVPEDCNLP